MKKVFLFSVALAALMLGSCSSSEDLNGGSTGKNEGKTSYIAINLNNVGNAPTSRAGEYQQGDGTYGDGTYEDGTDSESGVKKVRFYFFDEKGEPYPLKDQNANYIESTPDMTGGQIMTKPLSRFLSLFLLSMVRMMKIHRRWLLSSILRRLPLS